MDPLLSRAGHSTLEDTSDVTIPSSPDMRQGYPDVSNLPSNQGDTGQGYAVSVPAGTETEPEGTKPLAEPSSSPEAPESALNRLQQTNAQNAKLIMALGIDPLSDIAEQLERGSITPEMVRAHVAAKYNVAPVQPTPAQTNDPVALAETERKAARDAYNQEVQEQQGVSLETNQRLHDAETAVYEAKLNRLSQQVNAGQEAKKINESVEVVLNAARTIPEYSGMEQPLKQATEDVTLALTGMLADRSAIEMGIDPRSLNATQYQYFAGEANKILGKLAGHYRALGRNESKAGFTPQRFPSNVNNTTIPSPMPVPVDNSGQPVPLANPYAKTTFQNHEANARAFVNATRGM